MGIMLMDSVPPATMISAPPTMMRSAPRAMACNPEEQKRLMVMAEHSTRSPARSDAMRATFMPCSASGVAHPMITSSIWPLSTCGTRSSAPLMTVAAMSSGRVARKAPLPDLPTAVRTELTMTTSRIALLLAAGYWLLVPGNQPLAGRILASDRAIPQELCIKRVFLWQSQGFAKLDDFHAQCFQGSRLFPDESHPHLMHPRRFFFAKKDAASAVGALPQSRNQYFPEFLLEFGNATSFLFYACGTGHAGSPISNSMLRRKAYLNIFGEGTWFRNWITVLLHSFEMKINSFSNELFNLIEACSCDTESWNIRDKSAPSAR